jgi:LuxR family maltose regulon positive regulatory protein
MESSPGMDTASVEGSAALLRQTSALLIGDVAGAQVAGCRALALYPDTADPGRAVANINLGQTFYFAGDLTGAQAALRNGLQRLPGAGWSVLHVIGLGQLALACLDQGAVDDAEAIMADAERHIAEGRVDEAPATSPAVLARGRLLELHGDLAAAGTAYTRAAVLGRRGGRQLAAASALIALARLERRLRAYDQARTAAREARRVLVNCPDPGTLPGLLAKTERALQLTTAQRSASAADPDLSERELAILRLLASELSQREIGSQLYVSFNTVKSHTRSIFRKLGVTTRAAAVDRGRELGLL